MSDAQNSEQPKKKLSPEKAERLRAFQLKSLQTGWLIQDELERTSGIVSNPSQQKKQDRFQHIVRPINHFYMLNLGGF